MLVPLALMASACRSHQPAAPRGVIVLQAVEQDATPGQIEHAAALIRSRLARLRVHPASVLVQHGNQLRIELPNRVLTLRAQRVAAAGLLQFYDLEADLARPSIDGSGHVVATTTLFRLLKAVRTQSEKRTPSTFFLFNEHKRLVGGPQPTRQKLLAAARSKGAGSKGTVMAIPANRTFVMCRVASFCPGVAVGATARVVYYLFKYQPEDVSHPIPEATGADLKLSTISADVSSSQGNVVVRLGFTRAGAKKFHEITRAEAARGAQAAAAAGENGSDPVTVTTYAQHFAIVLDGELKSTPYIDYKQNPDGIDPTGTGAEISNISSAREAQELAVLLQTGALPVHFIRVR